MPLLYQQDINPGCKIALWHIQEPDTFFMETVKSVPLIKHPKKRLQHLAGRYLLQHACPFISLDDLLLSSSNKPFLSGNKWHFSISHCSDFAAVSINSNCRTGIDIELPSQKIAGIKHKYMSTHELELFPTASLMYDTLVWCAKEAVFKWYGLGGLDFKRDIQITAFSSLNNKFFLTCFFAKEKRELSVEAIQLNGLCMAWVNAD